MKSSSTVFISFKTEELEQARLLREKLVEYGYRVWWQEDLQVGQEWHGEIDKAVKASGAVIVLWSERSMSSKWVMHEASQSIISGTYTPVRIQLIEIEDPFSRIQATDLINWDGDLQHSGFQNLLRRLDDLLPSNSKYWSRAVWANRITIVAALIAMFALGLLTIQVQSQKDAIKRITSVSDSLDKQRSSIENQVLSSRNILSSLQKVNSQAVEQGIYQNRQFEHQSKILDSQISEQKTTQIQVSEALHELISMTYSLDSISVVCEIDSLLAWRFIKNPKGALLIIPRKFIVFDKNYHVDFFASLEKYPGNLTLIDFELMNSDDEYSRDVKFYSEDTFGKIIKENSFVKNTTELDSALIVFRTVDNNFSHVTEEPKWINYSDDLSKRKKTLLSYSSLPRNEYPSFEKTTNDLHTISRGNAHFIIRKRGIPIYSTSGLVLKRDLNYSYLFSLALPQKSFEGRVPPSWGETYNMKKYNKKNNQKTTRTISKKRQTFDTEVRIESISNTGIEFNDPSSSIPFDTLHTDSLNRWVLPPIRRKDN